MTETKKVYYFEYFFQNLNHYSDIFRHYKNHSPIPNSLGIELLICELCVNVSTQTMTLKVRTRECQSLEHIPVIPGCTKVTIHVEPLSYVHEDALDLSHHGCLYAGDGVWLLPCVSDLESEDDAACTLEEWNDKVGKLLNECGLEEKSTDIDGDLLTHGHLIIANEWVQDTEETRE